jgi:TRAP-type C4-dicarboxylate transport system permease small subunit
MNKNSASPQVSRTDMLFRALGWFSAMPVALIVILTFADVLGRYVFSSPVRGSSEMIEFAMALVIFTALPLITRQRGHVTVSLIDGFLRGEGSRKIKMVLCDGVSAVALGLLTWRLYLQGLDDLESGSATIVLSLTHAPLSFTLAAFAALTTCTVLALIWKTLISNGEIK